MKAICTYTIVTNDALTIDVYRMVLQGDSSWIKHPGQFLNITIDNAYLKRPISISDYDDTTLTILYKVVGFGTKQLSGKQPGQQLECLIGLGNGFSILEEKEALVIGGGIGIPPLYGLTKALLKAEKNVTVILGYNRACDVFYEEEFKALPVQLYLATADGEKGTKGFVTDVMKQYGLQNIPYYTCGPLAMLQAVYDCSTSHGLLSMEERMGCGFGACMGCTHKTKNGYKRLCKEGPVLSSEEVLWETD